MVYRPGTSKYYWANRDKPVAAHTNRTVLQETYDMLQWASKERVSKTGFEWMCKHMHKLLGPGNLFPKSEHIMEGIIEQESWHDYHIHVCPNHQCPGYSWPVTKCKEWLQHADDVCPVCSSGQRFRTSGPGDKDLQPSASIVYFGLENVIRNQFFGNADWCSNLGKRDHGAGKATT